MDVPGVSTRWLKYKLTWVEPKGWVWSCAFFSVHYPRACVCKCPLLCKPWHEMSCEALLMISTVKVTRHLNKYIGISSTVVCNTFFQKCYLEFFVFLFFFLKVKKISWLIRKEISQVSQSQSSWCNLKRSNSSKISNSILN